MNKNMIKSILSFLMAMVLVLGVTVSARATLVDMGDGTIYDTDLQLSWLKDANYAMTSKYKDAWYGHMYWSIANIWANDLVFAGFDNWRLPSTLQPDASCSSGSYGNNCTGSEMGHLYYIELGNPAGGPLTNTGPFINLEPYVYWSGTQNEPDTYLAWSFAFGNGHQFAYNKNYDLYAIAVRSGYRATSVPEPATLLLLGIGLAGMIVWRKKLGRQQG